MRHAVRQVLTGLLYVSCLIAGFTQAADVANGERLHDEKCVACHAEKAVFGQADIFYLKKDRKVNKPQDIKRMISLCNTELRLDLFPEDEQDIAAFLNSRYYQFK